MRSYLLKWVTKEHHQLFLPSGEAVGDFAIVTNQGIILTNGAVAVGGFHYKRNTVLPEVQETNGSLRAFKNLFVDPITHSLDDFALEFAKFAKLRDADLWSIIQRKMEQTGGDDLVIHAFINLSRHSTYGISLGPKKRCDLGIHEGYVYHDAEKQCLVIHTEKGLFRVPQKVKRITKVT